MGSGDARYTPAVATWGVLGAGAAANAVLAFRRFADVFGPSHGGLVRALPLGAARSPEAYALVGALFLVALAFALRAAVRPIERHARLAARATAGFVLASSASTLALLAPRVAFHRAEDAYAQCGAAAMWATACLFGALLVGTCAVAEWRTVRDATAARGVRTLSLLVAFAWMALAAGVRFRAAGDGVRIPPGIVDLRGLTYGLVALAIVTVLAGMRFVPK